MAPPLPSVWTTTLWSKFRLRHGNWSNQWASWLNLNPDLNGPNQTRTISHWLSSEGKYLKWGRMLHIFCEIPEVWFKYSHSILWPSIQRLHWWNTAEALRVELYYCVAELEVGRDGNLLRFQNELSLFWAGCCSFVHKPELGSSGSQ